MNYNNTPSTTTQQSPASMIFSYKPRTILNSLEKNRKSNAEIKTNVCKSTKPTKSKCNESIKLCENEFRKGEKVLYKNHFKDIVKWIPAIVHEKISLNLYQINIENTIRLVHKNQIRRSTLEDKYFPLLSTAEVIKKPIRIETKENNEKHEPAVLRRSKRIENKKKLSN